METSSSRVSSKGQVVILGISIICLWLFFQVFLDFEQNCYPRTASLNSPDCTKYAAIQVQKVTIDAIAGLHQM